MIRYSRLRRVIVVIISVGDVTLILLLSILRV